MGESYGTEGIKRMFILGKQNDENCIWWFLPTFIILYIIMRQKNVMIRVSDYRTRAQNSTVHAPGLLMLKL